MGWMSDWNWLREVKRKRCVSRGGHNFPIVPTFVSDGGRAENFVCDDCSEAVLKLDSDRDFDDWLKGLA